MAMWLLLSCRASAVQVEALDPSREWRVDKIEISGNDHFSDSQLMAEMITQSRPWYRFWEERPLFDPVTFATDLAEGERSATAAVTCGVAIEVPCIALYMLLSAALTMYVPGANRSTPTAPTFE